MEPYAYAPYALIGAAHPTHAQAHTAAFVELGASYTAGAVCQAKHWTGWACVECRSVRKKAASVETERGDESGAQLSRPSTRPHHSSSVSNSYGPWGGQITDQRLSPLQRGVSGQPVLSHCFVYIKSDSYTHTLGRHEEPLLL